MRARASLSTAHVQNLFCTSSGSFREGFDSHHVIRCQCRHCLRGARLKVLSSLGMECNSSRMFSHSRFPASGFQKNLEEFGLLLVGACLLCPEKSTLLSGNPATYARTCAYSFFFPSAHASHKLLRAHNKRTSTWVCPAAVAPASASTCSFGFECLVLRIGD